MWHAEGLGHEKMGVFVGRARESISLMSPSFAQCAFKSLAETPLYTLLYIIGAWLHKTIKIGFMEPCANRCMCVRSGRMLLCCRGRPTCFL